jgi:hypothetical protein
VLPIPTENIRRRKLTRKLAESQNESWFEEGRIAGPNRVSVPLKRASSNSLCEREWLSHVDAGLAQ